VRELENILERAIALCEGDIIMPVNLHLPSYEQVNDNVIIESLGNTSNVDEALDAKQRDAIISALNKTKWNRTAAAKLLGITFRALRYRIKKFDIE
jgi:two-component system response regulator PilR (NtrC family)